jgi:hypothetical protein
VGESDFRPVKAVYVTEEFDKSREEVTGEV